MSNSDTKERMVSTDMLKFVNVGFFVSMSEMLNGCSGRKLNGRTCS